MGEVVGQLPSRETRPRVQAWGRPLRLAERVTSAVNTLASSVTKFQQNRELQLWAVHSSL